MPNAIDCYIRRSIKIQLYVIAEEGLGEYMHICIKLVKFIYDVEL